MQCNSRVQLMTCVHALFLTRCVCLLCPSASLHPFLALLDWNFSPSVAHCAIVRCSRDVLVPSTSSVTRVPSLQVVIQDIQVRPPSSGPSQAEVVASATALGGPQGGGPTLRKGDKHSCVMQVQAAAAGQDLPLGHLVITWARAPPR